MLSGPSAVGKSTVVRCLRERVPDLHFSVSVTTRAPRPGEVDGVDYTFVTAEQFQQLIDDGALLEWAEIHGGLHRSGTPAAPVREAAAAGHPVLIEVDLAGARAVKQAMPEAMTVFLAPPSWEALESRLSGRGTETPEVMARRLDTARAELAAQDDFDEVVVNSQLESACAELVSLLVGPTRRSRASHTDRRPALVDPHQPQPPGDFLREHPARRRAAGRRDDIDPTAASAYDTPLGITNPPIDELLDRASSKYALVIYAAKRARQINDYYNQLGDGILEYVGPLVEPGLQEKPLSIAHARDPRRPARAHRGRVGSGLARLDGAQADHRRRRRWHRRLQGGHGRPPAHRGRPLRPRRPDRVRAAIRRRRHLRGAVRATPCTPASSMTSTRYRTSGSARKPTSSSSRRPPPTCWPARCRAAPTIC